MKQSPYIHVKSVYDTLKVTVTDILTDFFCLKVYLRPGNISKLLFKIFAKKVCQLCLIPADTMTAQPIYRLR